MINAAIGNVGLPVVVDQDVVKSREFPQHCCTKSSDGFVSLAMHRLVSVQSCKGCRLLLVMGSAKVVSMVDEKLQESGLFEARDLIH